ncbi:hypothetical protein [Mycolicibacterium fortuitum]|uniref:hypothetical protein n=1 Tax=Mycolicibacterium fortuitum TaxID=1766 RepID=UPI00096E88FB|nr:hypothetical protein [Mycolicibacterium fortuitum]OMC05861.1 hypothetical protein A5734_06630 [Mycolicibacterium fortuitum]
MDQIQWLVEFASTHWAVLGSLVPVAALFVGSASYVAGRREHKASRLERHKAAIEARKLGAPEREINRSRRLAELRDTLRNTRDPFELSLAICEARRISREPKPIRYATDWSAYVDSPFRRYPDLDEVNKEERFVVEICYFSNPAAPVPVSTLPIIGDRYLPSDVPREWLPKLLDAVFDSLPGRYSGDGRSQRFLEDMKLLTMLAIETGAPTYRIAGFVLDCAEAGFAIQERDIEELCAQSRASARYRALPEGEGVTYDEYVGTDYLHALSGRAEETKINVVAGVSRDVIAASTTGSGPRLSSQVRADSLEAYATILWNRVLSDIGRPTDEEAAVTGWIATTSPHDATAAMIKALGLIAWPFEPDSGGGVSHLLMRALESLPNVLKSFSDQPKGFGHDVGDELAEGVSELRRKCLCAPGLAADVISVAQQYVPDLAERPLQIKDRKAKEAESRRVNRLAIAAWIQDVNAARDSRSDNDHDQVQFLEDADTP